MTPSHLNYALDKLRENGYRITEPRRIVLEVLCRSNGHMTSGDLLEHLQQEDISRASVFRALELLTSLSIIRPTYVEPNTPTYVLLTPDGHHSHVLCTQCGDVMEIDDCHVDKLGGEIEERFGVRVTGHLLEFYGVCEVCQSG